MKPTRGNTPQTVIALPNLQFMFRKPMSDIPNTDGFKLLGCLENGLAIPLRVRKDTDGCHILTDQFNSHRLPSVFVGWVDDEHAKAK